MFRVVAVCSCVSIIAMSLVAPYMPHSLLPLFLTVNHPLSELRVGIAALLVVAYIAPLLWVELIRPICGGVAAGLLVTGLVAIASESLFVRPIDFFVLVLGIIFSCVIALEQADEPEETLVPVYGGAFVQNFDHSMNKA